MDEFNYLQFLNDDSELVEAEEVLLGEFPTFSVQFDEYFDNFSSTSAPDACDPESSNKETNPEPTQKVQNVDSTRFPEISSEEIEELKAVAVNKNTSRSTKQWMNVFKSWCQSRHLENVNIETMAPEELDNILSKFYAEVKKRDGDDYEPECLKIMQGAIERYLKEKNYPLSIVRSREFHNSQEILHAKAISLRQQGKGKRPNKSQPLTSEEESSLWLKGQLGDFNGEVLTNVNFKNLTEQLGFRGRQEHYDAYVEDFVIRQQEDGSEVVEFREGATKTRSGGLTISRRTTPQAMYSTDGGKTDPVRLFKLWLSKRPDGMKDKGPLYLSVINRPKSNDIWYTKIRMGENTIGNIMKSMASCLKTNKKLTNHSMRKTLVSKLKKSGQPRNVICEITGHARESSLDDYDEIDENLRKELSHIISGFKVVSNENGPNDVSNENSTAAKAPTIQNTVQQPVLHQRAPLVPINRAQQQGQMHQAIEFLNPDFQAAGFAGFPPSCPSQFQYRMAALTCAGNTAASSQNYTGCTFNFFSQENAMPQPQPQKKRRAYIIESDDED